MTTPDFSWTAFYQEFATRLRDSRGSQRGPLVQTLRKAFEEAGYNAECPANNIDPFTVMSAFNRGPRFDAVKRAKVAEVLGNFLGLGAAPQKSFDGIPTMPYRGFWFFDSTVDTIESSDIETLWDAFGAALELADSGDDDAVFVSAFDNVARKVKRVGIASLTMGLFWARPYDYIPLDANSVTLIKQRWPSTWRFGNDGPNGTEYLELLDELQERFVSSPDIKDSLRFSLAAWELKNGGGGTMDEPPESVSIRGPKARQAENWVQGQLEAKYGKQYVERYCRTHWEREPLGDGKLPGADFSIRERRGGPHLRFIEVKSAISQLPTSIRLTRAEFRRAKRCSDTGIPYELWIVVFGVEDGQSTVIDHKVIPDYEKRATELTIDHLVSMGVEV